MKNKIKKLSGINGWLLIVLIDFILSAISGIVLLYLRIIGIIQGKAAWGVYISSLILLIYLAFIISSIFLITLKKKSAVKTAMITLIIGIVFAVWYYILGKLIITEQISINDFLLCLFNLVILVLMIFYFKKSKRVKNTLIRK